MKAASGPRVYNVPIKVEQSDVREKKTKSEKEKMPGMRPHSKVNGCNVSIHVQNVESSEMLNPFSKETLPADEERMKINESLKKIDSVQEELKSYETRVSNFNGTANDKQYRYLEEMLTRCIIKLDDIETMGNEELRSARKKVVKMVQACIDLLESKVNIANDTDTSVSTNNVARIETIEKQNNSEHSTVLEVENDTEINEKCSIAGIPEENPLVVENIEESKLHQNESLISDALSSDCKSNVTEVEMAEVTPPSSDVNQNEHTGIVNTVIENLQLNSTNTVSDEVLTQPSEFDEIEMTEITQINNSQERKDSPKANSQAQIFCILKRFLVNLFQ